MKKHIRGSRVLSRILCASGSRPVTVATGVAMAQGSGGLMLEEIVVTARKREESMQDVPISISAFNQQSMQQLNISQTDEVALYTPSFSYTSAFGRNAGSDRPTIRGITSILTGVANSGSAATFIDGVYVGGTTQTTQLLNLERVEILKGPQAAQFGRGTYAGAINYVTRAPSNER